MKYRFSPKCYKAGAGSPTDCVTDAFGIGVRIIRSQIPQQSAREVVANLRPQAHDSAGKDAGGGALPFRQAQGPELAEGEACAPIFSRLSLPLARQSA